MATNPFFQHMTQRNEQDLSHDLVEEIIQMAGMDVQYIQMDNIGSDNWDQIMGENRFEILRDAKPIEMYLRNFESPYGGGDLYTKLGVSMAETLTLEVAYRRFEEVFGGRPREGDYVFIPATTPREMNDMFKVLYVETDEPEWNPQGTILRYILKCEKANFAHQELQTGVPGIDFSVDPDSADGKGDPNFDNDKIQEISDMFIDFDENHPFGKP